MKGAVVICLLAMGCAELATTTHVTDRVLSTQRVVTPTDFTYTGTVTTPDVQVVRVHVVRGTNTCAVNFNESYVVDTRTDHTLKDNKAVVQLATGIPLVVAGGVLLGTAGLVDPSVMLGGSTTDPTTGMTTDGVPASTLMYVVGALAGAGGLVLTTAGIVNYARQDSTVTTSEPRMRSRPSDPVACTVGEPAAYTPVVAIANGTQYTVGATDENGNLTIKLADVTSNLCNGQPDSLQVTSHGDVLSRVSIMPYCKDIAEQVYASSSTYEDLKKFVQNYPYSQRSDEARARVEKYEAEQAAREQAQKAAEERAERQREEAEQAQQARIDAENKRKADARRQKEATAREQRERNYVTSCGDAPTIDSWHGIPSAAYEWLKQNLNDDDFDVISCTKPQLQDPGCWVDLCKIRGKNSFGAKILTLFKFSIANDTVLRGREITD